MNHLDELGHPVKPGCPGKNTLQKMNEAMDKLAQWQQRLEQEGARDRVFAIDETPLSEQEWRNLHRGQEIWERRREYFTPFDGFDE